jgi:polyribonucleotide nucleotidyltransferase
VYLGIPIQNWRIIVNPVTKTFQYGGQTVTLETGRIARQASGAVLVTVENTTVLATVVAEKTARPGREAVSLSVKLVQAKKKR